MKYPLNECSDCVHRDGCEILARTRFWNTRNKDIDLSEAHCAQYSPDYDSPKDPDWELYKESSQPVSNIKSIMYEDLADSPQFMALQDSIDIMYEQGYVPISFELSTEFITEMMPEEHRDTKYKMVSLLGIKVIMNEALGLNFSVNGEDPENGDTVGITYYADFIDEDEEDD